MLKDNKRFNRFCGKIFPEEVSSMLTEYIRAALEEAEYEIIQDEEPYYG